MVSSSHISVGEDCVDTTLLTTAPMLDLTPTDLDAIMDELHAYHAMQVPWQALERLQVTCMIYAFTV